MPYSVGEPENKIVDLTIFRALNFANNKILIMWTVVFKKEDIGIGISYPTHKVLKSTFLKNEVDIELLCKVWFIISRLFRQEYSSM